MSRVFAYARVSTVEQLTKNQREQIAAAGYGVEAHRFIEEKISGTVPAKQRPGFAKLLDRMEAGDTLVVSKLDRHDLHTLPDDGRPQPFLVEAQHLGRLADGTHHRQGWSPEFWPASILNDSWPMRTAAACRCALLSV